jgi:hypothetical protein
MNSNPYEFPNVDDPTQNTDAVVRACPEFFEVIRITGSLSKTEALRMAAKCKAIPQRNSKTGNPTNTINGLLLFWGVCAFLVYLAGSKLVDDIRTANFVFENLLFWLTNIMVPAVSISALIVIFRRHRFRIETTDPPIWGEMVFCRKILSKWEVAAGIVSMANDSSSCLKRSLAPYSHKDSPRSSFQKTG